MLFAYLKRAAPPLLTTGVVVAVLGVAWAKGLVPDSLLTGVGVAGFVVSPAPVHATRRIGVEMSTNGRDENGRFLPGTQAGKATRFKPGNPGGPGNPHYGKLERFRAALMEAVTVNDVKAIAKRLVKDARDGDNFAIKELFDRLFGRPVTPILARVDDGAEALALLRQERLEILKRPEYRVLLDEALADGDREEDDDEQPAAPRPGEPGEAGRGA